MIFCLILFFFLFWDLSYSQYLGIETEREISMRWILLVSPWFVRVDALIDVGIFVRAGVRVLLLFSSLNGCCFLLLKLITWLTIPFFLVFVCFILASMRFFIEHMLNTWTPISWSKVFDNDFRKCLWFFKYLKIFIMEH